MAIKRWETFFSVFNSIITVAVIVVLLSASTTYITKEESEKAQSLLFQRLERVEGLMNKIIQDKETFFSPSAASDSLTPFAKKS